MNENKKKRRKKKKKVEKEEKEVGKRQNKTEQNRAKFDSA